MVFILEKFGYISLFFALLSFGGFLYCKIKTAIDNKKHPERKEKMSADVFFGKIGNTVGKLYVTLLTAGMFSFMILNPAFKSLIGVQTTWNWADVLLLILDVASSVFTIISIILLDTNDKK